MNGLGILADNEILSFYCDTAKADNLRSRVADPYAIPVTIPVIATDERNNNFHIAMKNALSNNTFRLLIDEIDLKQSLEEDISFMKLTSSEKMRLLLGNVQMDFMVSEAVKLEQEIKKGFIKLKEPSNGTKDRIVATEYANYFFYLKELEMIKNNIKEDTDTSEYLDCLIF